jgi:hypothetical protein
MTSQPQVWVAQGVFCPMCRGKHDLCFSHEPDAAGVYRLTCPTTGQSHDIQLPHPASARPSPPPQGVPIDEPRR